MTSIRQRNLAREALEEAIANGTPIEAKEQTIEELMKPVGWNRPSPFTVVGEAEASMDETGEVTVTPKRFQSSFDVMRERNAELERLNRELQEQVERASAGVAQRDARIDRLRRMHEARILQIVKGAHRQAARRGYCDEFDQFMVSKNLPPRTTRYLGRVYRETTYTEYAEVEWDRIGTSPNYMETDFQIWVNEHEHEFEWDSSDEQEHGSTQVDSYCIKTICLVFPDGELGDENDDEPEIKMEDDDGE